MLFHYAHLKDCLVKVGDRVKGGQQIGNLGKSGTSSAHLHFEIQKVFRTYTAYTKGLTREKVLEYYQDPRPYEKIVFPLQDHYGWEWLSDIGGGQLHPGIDLNGKGAGDSDLGLPVYSGCDGRVEFVGFTEGWGNHIFINREESKMDFYKAPDEDEVYGYFKEIDSYVHITDPAKIVWSEVKPVRPPGTELVPKGSEVKEVVKIEEKIVEVPVNVPYDNPELLRTISDLRDKLASEKTAKTDCMAKLGEASKPVDITWGELFMRIWDKIKGSKI